MTWEIVGKNGEYIEEGSVILTGIRGLAMGTTVSSIGLANKPPALPPAKQNNKASRKKK